MKVFGLSIGKEKPVSFQEFRDIVRLTIRRLHPSAKLEQAENGFNLTLNDKMQTCNLRQLYGNYLKSPRERDRLIQDYLNSLVFDMPAHSWSEVVTMLRPILKSAQFVQEAQRSMQRQKDPDSLPYRHFVGDLNVIAVVDLPGQYCAVTQALLDGWGVTLDEVLHHALSNLSMNRFPDPVNTMMAGSAGKRSGGVREEVGLVFEGNYLMATWLILDRFRDYIGQRLQGSYVVVTPSRSKLSAVRADEPGLITSLQNTNRNFHSLSYPLTGQLYHVSADTTGGVVTVYDPAGKGEALQSDSLFAAGQLNTPVNLSQAARTSGNAHYTGIPLDNVFGLNESTEETSSSPPIVKKSGPGRR